MVAEEALFLRKLFQRATQIVQARLQSFDHHELKLYSKTLSKFAGSLAETPENQSAREGFVQMLQKELLNASKFPQSKPLMYLQRVSGLTLTPFGSTVMGTSLRHGDVDISLDGRYQKRHSAKILSLSKIIKKELLSCLLYDVLKFLQFRNRLRLASPAFVLSRAKIPILKCTDRKHGFQCDFSVGNASGILRSRVLGEVIRHHPDVQYLILLFKKWAKIHNVNDASRGTFGSYPLTIMVLAFCAEQSLLPSLNAILDEPSVSDLDQYCAKVRDRLKNEKKNEGEGASLVELVLSCFTFLSLYCSREALYDGQGPQIAVCCRGGMVQDVSKKAGRKSGVFVRDPFDLKANCAKPVTAAALQAASLTLEQHLIEISMFLTCPTAERQQRWQSLFRSLFGTRLKFRQPSGRRELISLPALGRPERETFLEVLYDALIDRYFQREAKGLFRVQRNAHAAPFLSRFDVHLKRHKSCQEISLPEEESLLSGSSSSSMKDRDSLAMPAT